MKNTIDYTQYCHDMVRTDDRARYDTSLFAEKKIRPLLWALYAFNQEVAKTRESVSEPALGEIRLQWWRDVLEELQTGKVRDHPVINAMAAHFEDNRLYALLNDIIDARAVDMYDEGPADFQALQNYANGVGGKLSEAALLLSLGDTYDPSSNIKNAACAAGSAWAMFGLVRAIPFHWASNRNFVPGEEGQAALAASDADKMFELASPSIDQMLGFAEEQYQQSIQHVKNAPANAKHVFLLNGISKLYLHKLKQVKNNPFKLEEPSDFRRMMSLFSASLFGL